MRRNRDFIGPAGMGGMVSLWGASSLIKSIQRGTISTTLTSGSATINAVDMNNSFVRYGSMTQTQANNNWAVGLGGVHLDTATTVSLVLGANGGTAVFAFEVVEFLPGVIKSVQRGQIILTGVATSTTATVTAVNVNKASLSSTGWAINAPGAPNTDNASKVVLTDGTTVTANRIDASGTYTTYNRWELLEFF